MEVRFVNFKFVSIILILLFSNLFCKSQNVERQVDKYAVAILHTTVLNTSNFESVFCGNTGYSLMLDEDGHIMALEFIAIPNTVFEIHETIPKQDYNIYRITSTDYPYTSSELFIDSRFVKVLDKKPEERKLKMPSKEEILQNMEALEGYSYLWGGNFGDGVAEMLDYYKPSSELE